MRAKVRAGDINWGVDKIMGRAVGKRTGWKSVRHSNNQSLEEEEAHRGEKAKQDCVAVRNPGEESVSRRREGSTVSTADRVT